MSSLRLNSHSSALSSPFNSSASTPAADRLPLPSQRQNRRAASASVLDRSRTYQGQITKRRAFDFTFRLNEERIVDIDVENRRKSDFFGDLFANRSISVTLRDNGGKKQSLFSVSPGEDEDEKLDLSPGTYRLTLSTGTSKQVPFRLRLGTASPAFLNNDDLLRRDRTTKGVLTSNRPATISFSLENERIIDIDVENRRKSDFFGDLFADRNIDVELRDARGRRQSLFSVAPGDEDDKELKILAGDYRLILTTDTSKEVPYRLKLKVSEPSFFDDDVDLFF